MKQRRARGCLRQRPHNISRLCPFFSVLKENNSRLVRVRLTGYRRARSLNV